ncbi:MAG: hypothetical protein HS126_25285 [Anaerolineales bacterium]|nr:hypothetical protein [Anaerolineales bacterium]
MSWYASQIFAKPTPSIVAAFCSVKVFSEGTYHITNLRRDNRGKKVFYLPYEKPSTTQPKGLLIVREVCNPRSSAAEWFKHTNEWAARNNEGYKWPIIAWEDLVGPSNVEVMIPVKLPQSCPPVEFLCFLKEISNSTSTVVSYYYCKTGGCSMGPCFSWVFGKKDRVYVYDEKRDVTIEYQDSDKINVLLIQGGQRGESKAGLQSKE